MPLPRAVHRRRRRPAPSTSLALPGAAGLVLLAATALVPTRGAAQATGTLTIVVEGARNAQGQLRVSLFDRAEGFPGEPTQAIRTIAIPMRATRDSVQFTALPAGRYAVAVHHDENGNDRLDTRLGFPREGWGATNDPRPRVRPPRFSEAQIDLAGDRRVVVRLTY